MFDVFGAVKSVMDVVKTVVPNPTDLAKIQQGVTQTLVEASAKVMAADAQSDGWLTRSSRPLVVLWSLGMMSWVTVSPIFGLQTETLNALKEIPTELWNVVSVGIGGYTIARSVDKAVKTLKQ